MSLKRFSFILLWITLFSGSLPTAWLQEDDAQDAVLIDPNGCQGPPDDYAQLQIGNATLNGRTVAMLAHAQTLYGGTIDLTGISISQGSYTNGVLLSFGTHDAGGAVDISVRNLPNDWSILWDDIPILIRALRTAGFAAWFRDSADGMTPHIHAIAIGDAELSEAAARQLTGRYGYFRGFTGLPQPDGVPQADTHSEIGIIMCNWMRELGYEDLSESAIVQFPPYQLTIGQTVYVNTVWGIPLNLREQPIIGDNILDQLGNETPAILLAGPQAGAGYQWWQLQLEDGTVGWAVEAVDGGYTLVP